MPTDTQLLLLSKLRKNARISLAEVSRNTSFPQTTLLNAFRKIDKTIITRFSTILDFYKMGFMKYFFILKAAKDSAELIEEFIQNSKSINNAKKTKEGYFLECIFQSMDELIEFKERLSKLPGTLSKEVAVAKDIKREESFSYFNPFSWKELN